MGAEKTAGKSSHHRSKPPPVPPRPQHLIPVKIMSKYSSMPDILNGWRRDTNPDLLKLANAGVYSKRSIVDVIRPDGVKTKTNAAYSPMYHTTSNEYLAEKTLISHYRDIPRSNGNNYTMLPIRGGTKTTVVEPEKSSKRNGVINGGDDGCGGGGTISGSFSHHHVNEKSSKKFSCIPSRSNSKKKQQQQQNKNNVSRSQNSDHIDVNYRCGKNTNKGNDNGQISRTSWYVEDIQLSKCEINVAADTSAAATTTTTTTTIPNYSRYVGSPSSNKTATSTAIDYSVFTSNNNDTSNSSTKESVVNNVSQQRGTYRRKLYYPSQPQSPLPQALTTTMLSSPSLSSLPPLPKSLSDASQLWETTSKCAGARG
jgi:hypothetical protein